MQGSSPMITLSTSSPSFDSYSNSGKFAEIATRVVQELATESEQDDTTPDVFAGNPENNHHFPVDVEEEASTDRVDDQNDNPRGTNDDEEKEEEEDEEFEFAVSCSDMDSLSISAEDVFYNGQIRPAYPLFKTNLLLNQEPSPSTKSDDVTNQPFTFKPKRSPLRKLFSEENESQNSCSSSEADEFEGVAPETYCVWTPKKEVANGCKKSSSTGSSSKRWKFRDLLYRSSSDGKETFVFLSPSKIKANMSDQEGITRHHNNKVKGVKEVKGGFEEFYLRNRAIKEGDRRRSFLPYRQNLVGFLSNVHGVGRNVGPF